MSDLKPGDFIAGEYRIRRVFGGHGKSGMGVVYLVQGRTSEVPFVLKTFQSNRADAASIARFKAEAETWVNIGKHPNIVQCHWVNEFSGQLFVAAEYILPDNAGRNTLTQYLASGTLSLRQQLNWIAHFCFGMKHAMAHGLRAHRDIKPDNLMIDNRGRLKITDFGLAKGLPLSEQSDSLHANQGENEKLTAAGTAFGTPPFMSPEQFLNSSAVDHRADIYSFGVVIYMMISGGKLPIMPAGNSGWALAHRQQRIVQLDHPLMCFAERCLEKDPRRRFQSYDEILAVVGQACRKHGFSIPHDEEDARAEFERQWGIAMSLRNLGRVDEAITKLRQLTVRWPDSSEIYTELGAAYLNAERRQEALEATEKSLELDQYSTAAWNNLGGILANAGRLTEAKNAYGKSLQIEAENTGAMMGLVQLLMHEGELKDAKTWCELALFWRPEKLLVLRVASDCFFKCGEAAKAIELLDKLLATNPDDGLAWFKKGNAATGLGLHDEALLSFDRALKINRSDVEAWFGKGNALGSLGRFQEALVCFLEAEKLGNPNAAKGIEQCRRLLSPDAERHFRLGSEYQQEGNNAEAIRCYEKGLAIDPSNAQIWNNKGAALLALKRGTEAIACFDRAISLNSGDSSSWNNKGYALFFMEQYAAALPCLEEAERLGATHCKGMIGVCRNKLGKR